MVNTMCVYPVYSLLPKKGGLIYLKKILLVILSLILFASAIQSTTAYAGSYPIIVLSRYSNTVDIGDEFYIIAITSNASKVTWKSSNSRIASVNTYGLVTPKKPGKVKITAKIKGAEASCIVNVNETEIELDTVYASIERDERVQLSAMTSNGSKVTWKTNRKSIATVDKNGIVTGVKPGEATITATADGTEATCKIVVKKPTVKLNKSDIALYRGETFRLFAQVSSKAPVTWKTNKKSIATVDENGLVTAIKNGTATITAKVDGVSRTCVVSVKKPVIELSETNISLKASESMTIKANVSSGNTPVWSSSNQNVIQIDDYGTITALKKGKAYVYAKEDGAKARCQIQVTEP